MNSYGFHAGGIYECKFFQAQAATSYPIITPWWLTKSNYLIKDRIMDSLNVGRMRQFGQSDI